MALDLAGITNLEFYSPHYLEAVLESDLKSVFQKWKEAKEEEGTQQPHERLGRLANPYFAAVSQAEGERDPVRRWEIAREFHVALLEALGYPYQPDATLLDDNSVCPQVLSLERDGDPFLWVLDAPFVGEEDEDPLGAIPYREQLTPEYQDAQLPKNNDKEYATWRELLDGQIFHGHKAPRWVLFLAGSEVFLIERNKWPQGRYLRFELSEIFRRRQTPTLKAVAGLLHKDSLAPDAGICLHDALDENSHKHAYSVSSDLKYGVRRAVELLGNEAVWYRREVQKQAVFDEDVFPSEQLTTECLTFLYRMLFLFYIEARGGDLGIVPMNAEVYRDGYSLETLRDLELVPLTTEKARNGYYIHDSLRTLFRIINEGYPSDESEAGELDLEDSYHDSMRISAMNSPLFDIDRLQIIKNVRFRNVVMQEILQLLSLSAEKKRKSRGRISYAQLGINQLGAVYESILSYTGFFAHEDLYEVAAEKDCKALSGKPPAEREALETYFVPVGRIGDYKDTEIVKDANERKIIHKKGAFIFRLAGRNREKSASYYTPEVLTKCLVKYALKELLWEEGVDGEKPRRKKTADEILAITICEPAMGSSAFLIEAVNQLADAYLEARQEERDETITPEGYQREKRRVKARLATNNCYGVDLNPTAVELAKVSLWLATLYEEGKCPWFGLRLATGNSLVGARREVFKTVDVARSNTKDTPNWLGLVPEPVPLHYPDGSTPLDKHWNPPPRPKGTIYHFLLPAEGMAAFDKDKVIKEIAPEQVKRIKEWRKEFCKPFTKKDAERLEQISDAVDRLFAQVVRERVLATQEASDCIRVWGEPAIDEEGAKQTVLQVCDQEEVAASLEHRSSAYRRLKLAMDAWCALWFWPVEKANLLPNRLTWIAQLELILKGEVTHEPLFDQTDMFAALPEDWDGDTGRDESDAIVDVTSGEVSKDRLQRLRALSDAFRERRADYFEDCGLTDIHAVLEGDANLRAAQRIADRLHFHHWPLHFAEVFASRGGFDLILGNPPWIKLGFSDAAVLVDFVPSIEIHNVAGAELSALRDTLLQDRDTRHLYQRENEELTGGQAFFGSAQNYNLLTGLKANLYKCFIERCLTIGSESAAVGFLHPEGPYDDPDGGRLRTALYPRLVLHAQFSNELKLFPEIGNRNRFSINIYHARQSRTVSISHISNLLHPSTLDASWVHDGRGEMPLIKDEDGNWNLVGHAKRLVQIDDTRLRVFADFYDGSDVPMREARLPVVHSEDIVRVLQKVSQVDGLLGDQESWCTTREWNEGDRQEDGTIRRNVSFPIEIGGLILSGPHIYVSNPVYQTPNEGCNSHRAYTRIDLLTTGSTYLPRTVYTSDHGSASYDQKLPRWSGRPLFEYFRHCHRKRAGIAGERTLIPAIIPPNVESLGTLTTIAFESNTEMALCNAACASLVGDFVIRSTGRSDIFAGDLRRVPAVSRDSWWAGPLTFRTLRLNCLTEPYRDLWEELYIDSWFEDKSCRFDRRLASNLRLTKSWSIESALRSSFERWQAAIEIDVLTSQSAGLSVDELVEIFRIAFPVLGEHDSEYSYDQAGRIVPFSATASGQPAANLLRLAATLKEQAGFDVHAEYHPDGSNTQELRKQKIRLGKKEADVLGVSERCTMADLLAETEVRWSDEDHPEGRPARLVGLRYTDPGLEPRMERVYPTPWTRCDREADYRQAWAEFERRLGKKMPEGTPL